MPTYGLTDAGYTAPRTADFLTRVRDAYEERTGLAIAWDSDTVLGTLSAIMADLLGEQAEAGQGLYDSFDPANASGVQLDNLAILVGMTRLPASYSSVELRCSGTDGAIIREGSKAEGGGPDGTTRWIASEDGTISGGFVDLVFTAEDAGAISADVGEIDQIVTGIDGWSSVENLAAATVGTDRETDAELRLRRQKSLQVAGSRTLASLRANLLEVDGVQAAVCVDNPTMAEADVDGVTVPAAGVCVVVYPSTLTDDQKEALALVIYGQVAAGIATGGGESATVTGADGYAKTVRWEYAATQAVDLDITVTPSAGYDVADVEDPIDEALDELFAALGVGDNLTLMAVYALLAEISGVASATVLLDGAAADVAADNVTVLTKGTVTVGA